LRNGRVVLTPGPGINDGSTETITPGSKDIKNGRKENVLTIKRMEEKKLKNIIWDGTSRILEVLTNLILMAGLVVFAVLWFVVIFFLWIYDAIFGGWK